MKNEPSTVSTIDTTLSVVHELQRRGTADTETLAEALDLATSTVHRHLYTLRQQGYVVQSGSEYQLGLRFLTLGGEAQRLFPGIKIAQEKVDQVANRTGERVQIVVEEQGHRIYLYTQTGENAVRTDSGIGKRGLLHTSASGKAILSGFPDERVEEIINDYGLPPSTPKTITDRDALFAELERIRESGVAFNEQESHKGLRAVAALVNTPDGRPIGALSVSGPAHRFTDDRFREELPNLLLGASNELELRMEFE